MQSKNPDAPINAEFTQRTTETLDKLYVAFLQLAKENDPGYMQVQRTPTSLIVTVKKLAAITS